MALREETEGYYESHCARDYSSTWGEAESFEDAMTNVKATMGRRPGRRRPVWVCRRRESGICAQMAAWSSVRVAPPNGDLKGVREDSKVCIQALVCWRHGSEER